MNDFCDSVEELDKYFEENWEQNRGREQTAYFMNLLLDNLPKEVLSYMAKTKTIADVGCALGDGCYVLHKKFPQAIIKGIDASHVAIHKAVERWYKYRYNIEFLRGTIKECCDDEQFDVVISSNVLEHFTNPILPFYQLLQMAKLYLILLMPYKEEDRIPGHRITVNNDTFPPFCHNNNQERWVNTYSAVINTKDSEFWHGDQILMVYKTTI